jgi:hypothetical protein
MKVIHPAAVRVLRVFAHSRWHDGVIIRIGLLGATRMGIWSWMDIGALSMAIIHGSAAHSMQSIAIRDTIQVIWSVICY